MLAITMRVHNPYLLQALELAVRGIDGIEPHGGDADLVLTTTADCSVAECRALVATGARVVVLAQLPGDHERAAYDAAGAARYLPMGGGLDRLREAVASASQQDSPRPLGAC